MAISDVLNLTVAQAIAWLAATGIAGLVAYGLGFIPLADDVKRIVQAVVGAMLVAGVTALAAFIPDSFMALKLIDAAFVLLGVVVSLVGGAQYGGLKSLAHRIDKSNATIAARKLGVG